MSLSRQESDAILKSSPNYQMSSKEEIDYKLKNAPNSTNAPRSNPPAKPQNIKPILETKKTVDPTSFKSPVIERRRQKMLETQLKEKEALLETSDVIHPTLSDDEFLDTLYGTTFSSGAKTSTDKIIISNQFEDSLNETFEGLDVGKIVDDMIYEVSDDDEAQPLPTLTENEAEQLSLQPMKIIHVKDLKVYQSMKNHVQSFEDSPISMSHLIISGSQIFPAEVIDDFQYTIVNNFQRIFPNNECLTFLDQHGSYRQSDRMMEITSMCILNKQYTPFILREMFPMMKDFVTNVLQLERNSKLDAKDVDAWLKLNIKSFSHIRHLNELMTKSEFQSSGLTNFPIELPKEVATMMNDCDQEEFFSRNSLVSDSSSISRLSSVPVIKATGKIFQSNVMSKKFETLEQTPLAALQLSSHKQTMDLIMSKAKKNQHLNTTELKLKAKYEEERSKFHLSHNHMMLLQCNVMEKSYEELMQLKIPFLDNCHKEYLKWFLQDVIFQCSADKMEKKALDDDPNYIPHLKYKNRSACIMEEVSQPQVILPQITRPLQSANSLPMDKGSINLSNQTSFFMNATVILQKLCLMCDKLCNMGTKRMFVCDKLTPETSILMMKTSNAQDRESTKVYYTFINGTIENDYKRFLNLCYNSKGNLINPATKEEITGDRPEALKGLPSHISNDMISYRSKLSLPSVDNLVLPFKQSDKRRWFISDMSQLHTDLDSYSKMISYSCFHSQSTCHYARLLHYCMRPKLSEGLLLSMDWFLKSLEPPARSALLSSKVTQLSSPEVLYCGLLTYYISHMHNSLFLWSDKLFKPPVHDKPSSKADATNKFLENQSDVDVSMKYNMEATEELLSMIDKMTVAELGLTGPIDIDPASMDSLLSSNASAIPFITRLDKGKDPKKDEEHVMKQSEMDELIDEIKTKLTPKYNPVQISEIISKLAVGILPEDMAEELASCDLEKRPFHIKRLTGLVWLALTDIYLKNPKLKDNPIALCCTIMINNVPEIILFTKNQTQGLREISIMNAEAKIVMGVEESIMLSLSKASKYDFINQEENKPAKVEKMIKKFHKLKLTHDSFFLTIDFKAWNQNMHTPWMAKICKKVLDKIYPDKPIGPFVSAALEWFSTKRLLIDGQVFKPLLDVYKTCNGDLSSGKMIHQAMRRPEVFRIFKSFLVDGKVTSAFEYNIRHNVVIPLPVQQMFCQGIAGGASSLAGTLALIYTMNKLLKIKPMLNGVEVKSKWKWSSFDFLETSDDILMRVDFPKELQTSKKDVQSMMVAMNKILGNFDMKFSPYKCGITQSGEVDFNSHVYTLAESRVEKLLYDFSKSSKGKINAEFKDIKHQLHASDFKVPDILRSLKQYACDPGILSPSRNASIMTDSLRENKHNNPSKTFLNEILGIRRIQCLISRGFCLFPTDTIEVLNDCKGYMPSFIFGCPDVRGFSNAIYTAPEYLDIARAEFFQKTKHDDLYYRQICKFIVLDSKEALHTQEIHKVDDSKINQIITRARDIDSLVHQTLVSLENMNRISNMKFGKTPSVSGDEMVKILFRPCVMYDSVRYNIMARSSLILKPYSNEDILLIDELMKTFRVQKEKEKQILVTVIDKSIQGKTTISEQRKNINATIVATEDNPSLEKAIELSQELYARTSFATSESESKIRRIVLPSSISKHMHNQFSHMKNRLPNSGESLYRFIARRSMPCHWIIAQRNGFGYGVFVRYIEVFDPDPHLEYCVSLLRDSKLLCQFSVLDDTFKYHRLSENLLNQPGVKCDSYELDANAVLNNVFDMLLIKAKSYSLGKIKWEMNVQSDSSVSFRKNDQYSESIPRYYAGYMDRRDSVLLSKKQRIADYEPENIIHNPLRHSMILKKRDTQFSAISFIAFPSIQALFANIYGHIGLEMYTHLRLCFTHCVMKKKYTQEVMDDLELMADFITLLVFWFPKPLSNYGPVVIYMDRNIKSATDFKKWVNEGVEKMNEKSSRTGQVVVDALIL